ncbi:hypothetical protein RHSIM_Rhsim08G0220000 [Rhododendron simsii]|uniref:Uncharacterized protein n=1 Tax=Rhododendron simsii TaxID=118357 RepID=A0A834GHX9_RHOSS|nr:hypothetical protein RHSIM_Rhsim08G0220000 [Rhododendron simsii]
MVLRVTMISGKSDLQNFREVQMPQGKSFSHKREGMFHLTKKKKTLQKEGHQELFKLAFLTTSTAPGLPNWLAEMLPRYSEHDLFAAFNYLREKKIMVGGSRVSSREWLISPCLPDKGVGEAEDLRTLKRKFDSSEFHSGERAKKLKSSLAAEGEIIPCRGKGFPGENDQFIQSSRVNIGATAFPSNHIKEILYEGSNIPTAVAAGESEWETMTSYAAPAHLMASPTDKQKTFLSPLGMFTRLFRRPVTKV